MRRFFACLLLISLSPAPALVADDDRINDLNQDALQEAFRMLRRDYIRKEALSYEELNRAALDGLLERLGSGAQLVTHHHGDDENEPEVAFYAEPITKKIGYVRLGDYEVDEMGRVREKLVDFADKGIERLILDLRVPQDEADLQSAARLLDLFVEPNTLLFKAQKPQAARPTLFLSQPSDFRWEGELVLLIDSETCNAGEIIAAVLQKHRDCILVGETTPGQTVEYEQIPLTEDTFLRFAVAEVLLADDESLFQKGVSPDLKISQELKEKHKVFALTQDGPIHPHIIEKARPRLSEAALVQGFDPELDYRLARQRGEHTPYDRIPIQDIVLQRAVDLLVAVKQVNGDEVNSKQ